MESYVYLREYTTLLAFILALTIHLDNSYPRITSAVLIRA